MRRGHCVGSIGISYPYIACGEEGKEETYVDRTRMPMIKSSCRAAGVCMSGIGRGGPRCRSCGGRVCPVRGCIQGALIRSLRRLGWWREENSAGFLVLGTAWELFRGDSSMVRHHRP